MSYTTCTERSRVLRLPLLVLLCALPGARAFALSTPNDFCTGDPCIISSAKTADPGITLDFGTRAVQLTEILTVGNLPSGAVGSLTILAGSFTVTGNGQVKANSGTTQAGTVEIVTQGDIHLDGTRATGTVRMSGSDAGALTLTAVGSIYASGRINLDHGTVPDGGGSLTATALGNIEISGDIIAEGGVQGYGGAIDLQAAGDIIISGLIDISGGESGGGFLDVFGFSNVTLGEIDISAGGDAGDAGLGDITAIGDVTMNGLLRGNGADNGENCGDAGDIDISADGDINIEAEVTMKGRGLDCAGGFFTLDGDFVDVSAPVSLEGTGTEGFGGDIDFAAVSGMLISADLDVSGGDGAGDMLVSSDSNLVIVADLFANGRTTFSTGTSLLELDSGGTLLFAGTIDAHGGVSGAGGDVAFDACVVSTTAITSVNTTGPGGLITVLGTDSITLAGSFVSEPTTLDAIEIRYGTNADPPNLAGATFNVAPTLVLNPLAIPCALCFSNAECDDSNACTDDLCVPATGCENNPNTNPCDDGSLCTVGDTCSAGSCASGAPAVCTDGNPCTDDQCVPATGCEFPANTLACDDGDLCTSGDQCSGGTCAGTPVDCEDGNPCTDNTCVAGACQSANNSAPCDDGDMCTTDDTCAGGSCGPGAALDCNDFDPCTTDSCIPISGCQNDPIIGCGDGDNDGLLDAEDPCTTLDWTATPLKPPNQHPGILRMNLKKLSSPGEQQVLLKGFFNVAAPAQPVAPDTNGVHLLLSDSDGAFYEVNVPGGPVGAPGQCGARDGWSVAGTSSKMRWKYSNKSGALPPACTPGSALGLQSVQIKDLRAASKSALQVKAKAKNVTFDRPLATPLTLLRADLTLAAQPSPGVASQQAIDGQCAEGLIVGNPIAAASPAPFCKPRLIGATIDKLTCKGP